MYLILCILLFAGAKEFSAAKTPNDLQRKLFENYNPKVIPVKNYGDKVSVKVEFTPIHLREIDEKNGVLIMDAWIFLEWSDSNLVWDPSSMGGIKNLTVPSGDVWRPDISIYTTSPAEYLLPTVMTNVIIFENGNVLWVPPITVHSFCSLKDEDYPFDRISCLVKLGSWTYGSNSFNVEAKSKDVELKYFEGGNAFWKLESAKFYKNDTYYDCCPGEFYTGLEYTFTFERQKSNSIRIANTVCCFAVFLSLLMFWLDAPQKVVLGSLAEVLLAIVALYLGSIESPAAQMTAVQQVNPLMCLIGLFLVVEVVIINIAKTGTSYHPPEWLLIAAKGVCQPFQLCLSRFGPKDSESVEVDKRSQNGSEHEWHLISMALDRVAFFIAVVVILLINHLL